MVFDFPVLDLDGPIRHMTAAGAQVVGAIALVAVLIELLRAAGRAVRIVRLADAFVPPAFRRSATAVIGALGVAAFAAPPATAPPSNVLDWLTQATPSTTLAPSPSVPSTSSTLPPHPPTDVTLAPPTLPAPAPTTAARASTRPPITAARPAARHAAPTATQAPSATGRYRVRSGDCLWTIAARQLSPDASASAIDRAWRLIYATNHAAIGDNPDLIHPGTELALPPNARP